MVMEVTDGMKEMGEGGQKNASQSIKEEPAIEGEAAQEVTEGEGTEGEKMEEEEQQQEEEEEEEQQQQQQQQEEEEEMKVVQTELCCRRLTESTNM